MITIEIEDTDDVIELVRMLQQLLHEYLHFEGCLCREEEE